MKRKPTRRFRPALDRARAAAIAAAMGGSVLDVAIGELDVAGLREEPEENFEHDYAETRKRWRDE
jgi:hypothetical protein